MTNYIKSGNQISVINGDELSVSTSLEARTYVVKYDDNKNTYFLEGVDDMVLPQKIYGSSSSIAKRILSTFDKRKESTGVLLEGDKGSGKTLLAKMLCVDAIKSAIPVILVNEEFYGSEFNSFIQNINQPTIVLWDEFEKTYKWDKQSRILTLLDGVYTTKKLFVFTVNDSFNVNSYMKNRPGRIYYSIAFNNLNSPEIEEYVYDNVLNKDNCEKLIKFIGAMPSFNFDMMQTVVEEMNRYNESPEESIKFLNIEPEQNDKDTYNVLLTYNEKTSVFHKRWSGEPFNFNIKTEILVNNGVVKELDGDDDSCAPEPPLDDSAIINHKDQSAWAVPQSDNDRQLVKAIYWNEKHFQSYNSEQDSYIYFDSETSSELVMKRNPRRTPNVVSNILFAV